MAISARNQTHRSGKKPAKTACFTAKGIAASQLRRRKHQLARHFGIPETLLGGSLNQVSRKCGKPTCHCASGERHPMWTLTYSVGGKRHVELIPDALLPVVEPLTAQGRAYRDALHEILSINAQLVTLWRQQQRSVPKSRRSKK